MSDYCDGCCKQDTVENLIDERGAQYGDFASNARAFEKMQKTLAAQPGWEGLDEAARFGLQMILVKLVRIAGGGKCGEDTLADIEGYARLVSHHTTAR